MFCPWPVSAVPYWCGGCPRRFETFPVIRRPIYRHWFAPATLISPLYRKVAHAAGPPLLGVLMLQTRFPRPLGDVGNPDTWPFPVLYQTVSDATVDAVVQAVAPDPIVTDRFREVAQDLVQRGVGLITTSCGFLGPLHDRVSAGLPVPLISTSLMQIPLLRQMYGPARPIGVLTFDDVSLSRTHFGPWWDSNLVIQGLAPESHLFRVIREDRISMDSARAQADVLAAADRLRVRAPDLCCVILECTNFPPYRGALADRLGVPVHDLVTLVNWAAWSILSAQPGGTGQGEV